MTLGVVLSVKEKMIMTDLCWIEEHVEWKQKTVDWEIQINNFSVYKMDVIKVIIWMKMKEYAMKIRKDVKFIVNGRYVVNVNWKAMFCMKEGVLN